MSDSESQAERLERETYLAHRKLLIEAEFEQTRLVSKALIALAGAGLGLSLTFTNQFFNDPPPTETWALFLGWVCLLASLLFVLIEYALSADALRRERDLLDLDHDGNKSEADKNHLAPLTTALTRMALAAFILGAASLSYFTGINVRDKEKAYGRSKVPAATATPATTPAAVADP